MHHNAVVIPLARYRKGYTIEEVLASPMISDPLQLLKICALIDGAAVPILDTEEQACRCDGPLVRIAACVIATGQFGDPSIQIPTVPTSSQPGVAH